MNTYPLDQYIEMICDSILESAVKINKWRERFMHEVLLLYLLIPGRLNFLQLGRYSCYGEQRFRRQFSHPFDWLGLNLSLCKKHMGNRVAIAFDPSYISKSGKRTPYIGRFWSGCAKSAKRGLEISGIGAIDIDLHACFHLEAEQTPPTKTLEQVGHTLIDWYLHVLGKRAKKLLELSTYVVADAYFSKKKFVEGLALMGFHLISRLRDDAVLMYLTKEAPTGKKGRPRKYDGQIDLEKLDDERFEVINLEEGGRIFSAVVYAKALERNIRLCIWESEDKTTKKLYFSTDTQQQAKDVLEYYRCRFQIEFCYRDSKQFTGLTHAQSRDLDRLHFHFNASLTSVNMAKAVAIKQGKTLSMATVKVLLHNSFLLQRFIHVSGIKPDELINRRLWKEVIEFAAIAA